MSSHGCDAALDGVNRPDHGDGLIGFGAQIAELACSVLAEPAEFDSDAGRGGLPGGLGRLPHRPHVQSPKIAIAGRRRGTRFAHAELQHGRDYLQ
jgi:hypothetical protein